MDHYVNKDESFQDWVRGVFKASLFLHRGFGVLTFLFHSNWLHCDVSSVCKHAGSKPGVCVFILGVISLFLADFQWSCIFANYAKFSCIFNQEVGACCWIRWLTVLYFGSFLLAQKHNTAYAIQSHGIVQVNPPRHANTRRLIFGHSVSTRERRRSRWSNTIPQPWNEAMLQHCAAD